MPIKASDADCSCDGGDDGGYILNMSAIPIPKSYESSRKDSCEKVFRGYVKTWKSTTNIWSKVWMSTAVRGFDIADFLCFNPKNTDWEESNKINNEVRLAEAG